jgi:hypothetical protein
MKEWAPVRGYEDLYEASRRGFVQSLDREVAGRDGSMRKVKGKVLTPRVRPDGTVAVNLWRNNEYVQVPVRRIVLEAHDGPRPEGMDAVNVDGNPANNKLSNLEWKP